MTTKVLTGTYSAGYTLSAGYDTLSITGSGVISGAAGGYGRTTPAGVGGVGVWLAANGTVHNAGLITGGVGGDSAYSLGGAGGVGLTLAAGGPVTNNGRITGGAGGSGHTLGTAGSGAAAVFLAMSGSVDNAGYIAGGAGGVSTFGYGGAGGTGLSLGAGGTVANEGTIHGGSGGSGSYDYAPGGVAVSLAARGALINHGTILGGAGGQSGGGYQYAGGNAGGAGAWLSAGGAVNNYGAVTGGAGGAARYVYGVAAGAGGAGVWLSAGGAVSNYGAITGGAGGAFIIVASLGVGGAGGAGVLLAAGGLVVNHGAITGGAGGAGLPGYVGAQGFGVYAGAGAVAAVVNFGTITGGVGIAFKNAGDRLIAEAGSAVIGEVQGGGGTLELAGGSGTITGLGGAGAASGSATLAFSGFGAFVFDAGSSWTVSGKNTPEALTVAGALTIADRGALTIQGGVLNSGQITLAASTHVTRLIVGKTGATLSGGGTVLLGGGAFDQIIGASVNAVLTNVDNTIAGAGQIGLGKMSLVNGAAGVIKETGASLTINTGSRRIVNNGIIEATGLGGLNLFGAVLNQGVLEAQGGNLTVDGAVSGNGSARIGGGVLSFVGGFSESVYFTGPTGELALGDAQGYHGRITGFSTTGATSLDLRDIGFVSSSEATFSGTRTGGVLTVTDGTHTAQIRLVGNYTASTWTCSSDGAGGVVVVDPPAANAPQGPSPLAFISRMAGLARTSASMPIAPAHLDIGRLTLTAPRPQLN